MRHRHGAFQFEFLLPATVKTNSRRRSRGGLCCVQFSSVQFSKAICIGQLSRMPASAAHPNVGAFSVAIVTPLRYVPNVAKRSI